MDRQGRAEPVEAPVRPYWMPALSPDGRRLALTINFDLWILDLGRGTLDRLTFGDSDHLPVWSPTGDRIVFSGDTPANLYWVRADGTFHGATEGTSTPPRASTHRAAALSTLRPRPWP